MIYVKDLHKSNQNYKFYNSYQKTVITVCQSVTVNAIQ